MMIRLVFLFIGYLGYVVAQSIDPKRLLISTVIDPSSAEIVRDALSLIRSLRLFGGRLNEAMFKVAITTQESSSVVDSHLLQQLYELNVEVSFIQQTRPGLAKTLNKFEAFKLFDEFQFTYFLWLDADIIVFADPLELFRPHSHPGQIQCVPDIYSYTRRYPLINSTSAMWNPNLAPIVLLGESEVAPHGTCNTGMLLFDSLSLKAFLTGLQLARQDEFILKHYGHDRFVDSLYFIHAVHSQGLHVSILPFSLNFMAFFEEELAQDTQTDEIFLAHLLSDTALYCLMISSDGDIVLSEPICRCVYENKNMRRHDSVLIRNINNLLLPTHSCQVMAGYALPPSGRDVDKLSATKSTRSNSDTFTSLCTNNYEDQNYSEYCTPTISISSSGDNRGDDINIVDSEKLELHSQDVVEELSARTVGEAHVSSADAAGGETTYHATPPTRTSSSSPVPLVDSLVSCLLAAPHSSHLMVFTSHVDSLVALETAVHCRVFDVVTRQSSQAAAAAAELIIMPEFSEPSSSLPKTQPIITQNTRLTMRYIISTISCAELMANSAHFSTHVFSRLVSQLCKTTFQKMSDETSVLLDRTVEVEVKEGNQTTTDTDDTDAKRSQSVFMVPQTLMFDLLGGGVGSGRENGSNDTNINYQLSDVFPLKLRVLIVRSETKNNNTTTSIDIDNRTPLPEVRTPHTQTRTHSSSSSSSSPLVKYVYFAVTIESLQSTGHITYTHNLLQSSQQISLDSQLMLSGYLNTQRLTDGLGVVTCCDSLKGVRAVRRLIGTWRGDALLMFIAAVPHNYNTISNSNNNSNNTTDQPSTVDKSSTQQRIQLLLSDLRDVCDSRRRPPPPPPPSIGSHNSLARCIFLTPPPQAAQTTQTSISSSNSSSSSQWIARIASTLSTVGPQQSVAFVYMDVYPTTSFTTTSEVEDVEVEVTSSTGLYLEYLEQLTVWYALLRRNGLLMGTQFGRRSMMTSFESELQVYNKRVKSTVSSSVRSAVDYFSYSHQVGYLVTYAEREEEYCDVTRVEECLPAWFVRKTV